MSKRFQDRVAIAFGLAREGARVFAADRSADALRLEMPTRQHRQHQLDKDQQQNRRFHQF
jgi:NAD(P)-dependent dehydrogenase (short-subunit alcohol dehydrogenase family)